MLIIKKVATAQSHATSTLAMFRRRGIFSKQDFFLVARELQYFPYIKPTNVIKVGEGNQGL